MNACNGPKCKNLTIIKCDKMGGILTYIQVNKSGWGFPVPVFSVYWYPISNVGPK